MLKSLSLSSHIFKWSKRIALASSLLPISFSSLFFQWISNFSPLLDLAIYISMYSPVQSNCLKNWGDNEMKACKVSYRLRTPPHKPTCIIAWLLPLFSCWHMKVTKQNGQQRLTPLLLFWLSQGPKTLTPLKLLGTFYNERANETACHGLIRLKPQPTNTKNYLYWTASITGFSPPFHSCLVYRRMCILLLHL